MGKTVPSRRQAREAPGTGGMPADPSSGAAAAVASIGIDIGGTKTLGVLLAADGSVLARSRRPTPAGGNGPVEEAVLGMVSVLVADAHALGSRLGGLGIGAPGYVDSARGLVLDASNLRVRDLALGDAVRSRFHLPTLVVHDVKAATMAEAAFGAGRGLEHFAYLNIGTGVAAGFVLNGELFEGEAGRAGEIGHVVLRSDGPPCSCGKRGCLEALASGAALAVQAREAVLRHPASLLARLASGDHAGGGATGADAARGEPVSNRATGGDPLWGAEAAERAEAGAVAVAGVDHAAAGGYDDAGDHDDAGGHEAAGGHASAAMKATTTGHTKRLSGTRLLARAAEAGDPYAIAVLDTAAAYLGQAAAWLVDTLGLQRVVLGGGVVQVGEALLGPLRRVAVESMLEANRADRVVEATTLGTDGGAIGAALAGRAHHLRMQEVTCSE